MGDKSGIEWTSATWNPIRGCSRVSEGCRNCYAERTAIRQSSGTGAYRGLVTSTPNGPRWTGEVRFVEEALTLPLRWKAPRRIFVNSMSDLFHPRVRTEWIIDIFKVMEQARQHQFQVLTKRADLMRARLAVFASKGFGPFPNVWLGVSVEDRETYKARVLPLANTPAAVRFVSMEPLLGDLGDLMLDGIYEGAYQWAIIGGESGPGARPFNLAWPRSVIAQCKAAGVACFVKQLGSRPFDGGVDCGWPNERLGARGISLRDRKGGDMAEWPSDLRVREFPR